MHGNLHPKPFYTNAWNSPCKTIAYKCTEFAKTSAEAVETFA